MKLRPVVGAGMLLVGVPCVSAYPEKPIRIVTSFPAGSVTDIMARPIAAKMPDSIGQPVIVENRPGAGGSLAAEFVAGTHGEGIDRARDDQQHARP